MSEPAHVSPSGEADPGLVRALEPGVLPGSGTFEAVSPLRLWRQGSRRECVLVFGGWLLSVLASVGLGLATVIYQWSGLPLDFSGTQVYITLYPPLLICLWWTLCFGWWWGAIPAYLATLTLALYAGMPLAWALVFAAANPLGFAVLVIGYRAIAVPRDMRSLRSVFFYLQLAFVGSVFGSAGALVWSYTNRIDTTGLLPIWQGWWLGAFLQSAFIVGPLMYLSWPALARWQDRHPDYLRRESVATRHRILHLIWATVGGTLAYGLLTIWLGTDQVARAADADALARAAHVLAATSWVFFWVFVLIVLFMGFFIYRLFMRWQEASDALLAQLTTLARTDELTGLINRRALEEHMQSQWHRLQRYGEPAGVLLLDIDHFKNINDGYGHDAGDAVLRALAERLRENVRVTDVAGRWGGEEFLILLPAVDRERLCAFAERLRQHVEDSVASCQGQAMRCTISLGLSMMVRGDPSYQAALKRADQALYEAKAQGRNRSVYSDVTEEGQ